MTSEKKTENLLNQEWILGIKTKVLFFALLWVKSGDVCSNKKFLLPVASAHWHALPWQMQQSGKMLNNAENWMNMFILTIYIHKFVGMRCMDVHGMRRLIGDLSDINSINIGDMIFFMRCYSKSTRVLVT